VSYTLTLDSKEILNVAEKIGARTSRDVALYLLTVEWKSQVVETLDEEEGRNFGLTIFEKALDWRVAMIIEWLLKETSRMRRFLKLTVTYDLEKDKFYTKTGVELKI
jgi:hypothetical protein